MKQEQPKNKSLDTPAVANEEKHIHFLKEEQSNISDDRPENSRDEQHNERKKEWEAGIEAGKNKTEELSFQQRDLNEQEEY